MTGDSDDSKSSIPQHIQTCVEDAVKTLMEHCDSVRIFVTVHESEQKVTGHYTTGAGNFHAQLGGVKEWVIIQDEYTKESVRKSCREEEE